MIFTSFQRSTCVVVLLLVTTVAIGESVPSPTSDEASSPPGEITTISPSQPTSREIELESAEQQRGRGSKMTRRMILPLLVGILLKVGSLLPVFLGKLTLMAIGSIMTSKLALIIAGILIIHKFQSDHSWTTSTGHATDSEESYALYPYRRRG